MTIKIHIPVLKQCYSKVICDLNYMYKHVHTLG